MTYLLGLVGYPLDHSLSPRLHNAAMQAMSLDGRYLLYPIPPSEEDNEALRELLELVRTGDLDGLNVTIPFKQVVMAYVDKLTPNAQVGAINTIYSQSGRLIGDNTDFPGFLRDLQRFVRLGADHGIEPRKALVLGAGGSARAVVFGLVTSGWEVVVAARRKEQACTLVDEVSRSIYSVSAAEQGYQAAKLNKPLMPIQLDGQSIAESLQGISLIINSTPVGMFPLVDFSPWPAGCPYPNEAVVYDLVYNPPVTQLMIEARNAGLAVSNGLGMLVEQAALALEIWTAHPVPRQVMWQAAENFVSMDK